MRVTSAVVSPKMVADTYELKHELTPSAKQMVSPREHTASVTIRCGKDVCGMYRTTMAPMLARMPASKWPKWTPSRAGIPTQSEARRGMCQGRPDVFQASSDVKSCSSLRPNEGSLGFACMKPEHNAI